MSELLLLRLVDVERKAGVKRSYIYREIKNSRFPAPIKIGRTARWPAHVIDSWIQERIAESTGAR